jgi:WD40 repeat protein
MCFSFIALVVATTASGQEYAVAPVNFAGSPHSCSLSRDGKLLAVGGMEGFGNGPMGGWVLWDLHTGRKVHHVPMEGGDAHSLSLSPDGKMLIVGGNAGEAGGELKIFDCESGKVRQLLQGHRSCLHQVLFAPDGKHVISVADDDVVRLWRARDGAAIATYRFVSKVKRRAESCNWQFWENVGKPLSKARIDVAFEKPIEAVYRVALSPNGQTLAVTGGTNDVFLIETYTGKLLQTLHLKEIDAAITVAFSADGTLLAVGAGRQGIGEDHSKKVAVECWLVPEARHSLSLRGHRHSVLRLAVSPDKKTVISGGTVDGLRVWDAATGKQKYHMYAERELSRINDLAFFPDGETLLVIAGLQPIGFWDTISGKPTSQPRKQR